MKRRTKIILAAGAAVIALGSLGSVVIAKGKDWHSYGRAHHNMMSGDMHGAGMMGNRFQMIEKQFELHDLNNDGIVSQTEVDQRRSDEYKLFDENKDGLLSLSEFQTLWLKNKREMIVDRFQTHDNDGDGKITKDEFLSPMANIIARHDTDDDGKISMKELRKYARGWRHGRHSDDNDDDKRDNN